MIIEYMSEEEQNRVFKMAMNAHTDEERDQLLDRLPLLPGLAKVLKQHIGLEALLNSNVNLYEAVQEYGEDFIKK